ncbi:hypothetical protein MKX03_006249 [Papaver bracteatum]|nr:hypothetical protein MKX03_006249 [Papaver bracteatum]
MVCTLCNGAMIVGDGNAIFTAECSHSFHFSCINTYVRLGNRICQTCDTKWKDIPIVGPAPAPLPQPIPPPIGDLQIISDEWGDTPSIGPAPASYPTSGLTQATLWPWNPSQTNFNDDDPIDFMDFVSPEPVVLNDDDPIDIMDFLSSESVVFNDDPIDIMDFPSSESVVFNDDDPLDVQSNISASNISIVRSIDIKTHTELPAVPLSVSQENFHILVNLKSNVTDIDQVSSDITFRAPIDLVTVLDVSGSMTSTKIQLLKRAMGFVIDNLGPSDRLSVISFSYDAHRLFPLLVMTESGKQQALQAVNSLVAGGGTNIVEGLKKGTKDSYTKTINLKEFSSLQIPIHTFGFGADHDPIMLHSIEESSKGTFSFVEAEGLIQDAFGQCIGGLLSVVVQDLQVHIQSLDPHLCLNQLKAGSYSTHLTGDNRTGSVDIGDLYADEERDFIVLLNIPVVTDEISNDQMKLVSVWCGYKNPFTNESVTTETIEVKLQRPEMVKEEMVVSIEVDRQKNRLQAAEAMSNSHAAAERGDLPTAWSVIDGCRMQLSDTASAHAGDKLSVHLDFELQEVRSRMESQEIYESAGRGYLLSEICSQESQKATVRGDSTESIYQTASMSKMVQQSRAFVPNPLAHNLARVSSSSTSLISTLPMASNGGGGGGTGDDGNKASNGI